MKSTKILFWVFTALLLFVMVSSALGTFFSSAQSEAFAKTVGFPVYLFKLLAVAKILGSIALVTPGFKRLKEWAYAGFTFDLIGASDIFINNHAPLADWLPFIGAGFVFLIGSYVYFRKLSSAA